MSSRDTILFSIIFSFTFGILFTALALTTVFWLLPFFLFVLLLIFCFERKFLRTVVLFSVCAISFFLGFLRFTVSIPETSLLANQIGQQVTLEGTIVSDPDIRDFNTKFIVDTKSDLVLVTAKTGVYAYGDTVRVSGVLEQPENFETETQRTFDYTSYLSKDSIYFLLPKGSVEITDHEKGNTILSILYNFKHTVLSIFEKIIPEPEQSLLGGILLGTKQSLDEHTRDALVMTGTIHIVALSGFNVSITAAFFMQVLQNVGSQIVVSIGGILGIVLFVLMTGASSTAIRAGLMAMLFIIARFVHRPYDALRILCITAVLMLLFNPHYLVNDISFQLSFIATAGIILLEPIIREYFKFLKWRWLISLVSVTLSAQIAVLPFLVWAMGTLSLVSVPINFLVLPIVEILMFTGFITALLGIFIFPLAVPIGYISYVLLHLLLLIVHMGAAIPHAAIIIPEFSIVIVLGIYSLLGYLIYTKYKNRVIK